MNFKSKNEINLISIKDNIIIELLNLVQKINVLCAFIIDYKDEKIDIIFSSDERYIQILNKIEEYKKFSKILRKNEFFEIQLINNKQHIKTLILIPLIKNIFLINTLI